MGAVTRHRDEDSKSKRHERNEQRRDRGSIGSGDTREQADQEEFDRGGIGAKPRPSALRKDLAMLCSGQIGISSIWKGPATREARPCPHGGSPRENPGFASGGRSF